MGFKIKLVGPKPKSDLYKLISEQDKKFDRAKRERMDRDTYKIFCNAFCVEDIDKK